MGVSSPMDPTASLSSSASTRMISSRSSAVMLNIFWYSDRVSWSIGSAASRGSIRSDSRCRTPFFSQFL